MNLRNPKFSIWAASCIAIGLLTAYVDGVSLRGVVGSALLMSSLICACFAIAWVHRLLKARSPSGKRKGPTDP